MAGLAGQTRTGSCTTRDVIQLLKGASAALSDIQDNATQREIHQRKGEERKLQ